MRKDKFENGQALVLVLLSLAVVLTIVLFILSRSITDVAVSSNESQSVSAFSAAEAGVEQALVVGSAPSGPTQVGDATYNAQVSNVARGATSFIYPVDLNSGDTLTLWLHSQDSSPNYTGRNIKICWGKQGTSSNSATTPAIELSLLYETTANNPATARVFRAAYDPSGSRRVSDNFANVDGGRCTVQGQTFQFQKTINISGLSNPQYAVIRMFYNTNAASPIAFDSTNASVFPSQGIKVDSAGTAGQSSRKVEVFQSWPEVPGVFQYGLYSPSGITK